MGLTTFAEIARELIARGRDRDTPAMAVRWATRPDQETLTGHAGHACRGSSNGTA